MIRKSIILFITILLYGYCVELFAQQTGQLQFITIADIHFDPFQSCYQEKMRPCPLVQTLRQLPVEQWSGLLAKYDNTIPYYRFNTNYFLLRSSLQMADQVSEQNHAQFVLILGDFIGHDYERYYAMYSGDRSKLGHQTFFKKTFEYLTYELNKTFPGIDVFPVFGNNDSYYGDYELYSNGKLYHDLQSVWINLIKNKTNRALMASSFSKNGYYAVEVRPDLRIIILNTVLFSTKADGKGINQAAWEELDWFHDQLALAQAKQQKVMIAMHIPPGIDIYASLEFRLLRLVDLWKLDYTKRFEAELRKFSEEVLGIFVGHLHTDWFQILTLSNVHRIPITGTSSISPIYGNDPSFKLYTYSLARQRFVKFETYTYTRAQHLWRQISYQNKKQNMNTDELCHVEPPVYS